MNQAINTCITGLNNIGQGFWDYAVSIFVQSSVLIILLLIIDFLLRKRVRAVFRYCVWMLVFVKLILPTSFALPTGIGYWLADYLPTETSVSEQRPTPAVEQAVPAAVPEQRQVLTLESAVNETVSAEVKLEPICWQGLVFLGWLAGVLVLSALLIQRVWFVKALVAQSKPAKGRLLDTLNECRSQIGIRKTIELRLSDNIASPAVCGLFKPMILMSTTLLEKLSLEKLKAVLIHELAHIKRRDIWVNVVQTVLQIVYFYNPLLWLANAMVRRVREQAVDEMVLVALGAEADSYSNTLIDIAELAFWKPNLGLRLIGVVESKSSLKERIKIMLNRPIPKSAKLGVVGVLAVIIAGAVLLPMAKAKENQKALRGIDEKLNVSDKAGELTINSLYMTSPDGKSLLGNNSVTLSVGVTNNSQKEIYLGFEYYTDSGTVAKVFSPRASSLAQIRRVASNWQGRIEFPIRYNRFVKGGYVKITLAKCSGNQLKETTLAFLPVDSEVLHEKKYVIFPREKEKASKESTFKKSLPNGVTVELVGLGRNPWESEQEWWQPNGTEIEKPEFKANEPPHKWPIGPNGLQFECAALFKFSNYAGKSVSVPEIRFSNRELLTDGLRSSIADDGSQVTYIVSNPWMHIDPNKADISLAVGTAPFKKARTLSKKLNAKTHVVYTLDGGLGVIRHPLRIGSMGTLAVDLTCPKKDYEFRVIAELKNGQTEQWHGGSIGEEVKYFAATPRRKNIKVEDIDQLIIEYRPYQWVTFKNVSLKPNFKTDVQIEIEKPDVQVEGERDWGEAVEGVQMRVRPERQRWYEGETPKFRVDMRNKGTVEWKLGLTQSNWEVELDGLWHRVGVLSTGWFQKLLLGPGQEHKDIEFYPGVWSEWNINGKPLKFTPGSHTVRLSFVPSTGDRANWRRLRVVSNAVVIEVLPAEADKRDWGEAVAGLQCGLRADKRLWKADETPRLQAVARNVGRNPWRLPEFFFLKVAGKIWRWKGPGPGEPVELKPGEDLDKTTILLSSEDWVPPYESDLRLKLSPGKHIVQLVIIVSVPVPPEVGPVVTIPVSKQLRIESNVVVVEVLPTDSDVQVEEQSGMDRANNVLLKAGLETLGPLDNLSAEARNKLHDRIRKADVHEEQVLLKAIVIQLQSEQDPQKRREIMIHLATFGRNQVVAATLKGMLHSESDRGIRKLAAYILGKVGSEEDIDDLLDAIKKDKGAFPHSRDLANTAYFSIGEIGGDKAAIILLKLWDDKELVPDFSLFSMGFTGSPLVLDLLQEVLERKEDRFRPNAAGGLSALAIRNKDNKEMAEQLLKLLRKYVMDDDPKVRENTLDGFYSMGQAEDLSLMNFLLDDPYSNVVNFTENGEVKEKTVYPIREKAQWAITKINRRIAKTKKNVFQPIKKPAVQVEGEKR